jgi:hypothetical protein
MADDGKERAPRAVGALRRFAAVIYVSWASRIPAPAKREPSQGGLPVFDSSLFMTHQSPRL